MGTGIVRDLLSPLSDYGRRVVVADLSRERVNFVFRTTDS